MQLDFKGKLEGFTPEEAYNEYDLKKRYYLRRRLDANGKNT